MNTTKKKDVKQEVKNIKEKIKLNNLSLEQSIPLYNNLYYKYGRKTYIKFTPESVIDKDIDLLMDENRFIELYMKYGEKEFNIQKYLIKSFEIEFETGNKFKSFLYKHANHLKDNFIHLVLPLTAIASAYALALPVRNCYFF